MCHYYGCSLCQQVIIIMDIEFLRDYCLSKQGVSEELPFGPDVLVFKVLGKIFALTNLGEEEFSVNLKNTPEKNLELRADYFQIIPGFHMNKKHWNTIYLNDGLNDNLIRTLLDESYEIVVSGLPKKLKQDLLK